MRDSFVLIMSLLLITVCAELDKDGFNLYKDHLRGRADEPLELDPEIERRMLSPSCILHVTLQAEANWERCVKTFRSHKNTSRSNFYRAPLRFYVGYLPILPQEYGKRATNVFKNYMLNKEVFATQKRTSKAALSLMLQSKQEPDQEKEHYCLYGK